MLPLFHPALLWLLLLLALAPGAAAQDVSADAGAPSALDATAPTLAPADPTLLLPPPPPPVPPLVTPPEEPPRSPTAPALRGAARDAGAPSPSAVRSDGAAPSDAFDVTVRGERRAGPGEFALHGTGSKVNAPLEELAATVTVVDRQTLHERGAYDTQTALQLLPGVLPLSRYGGFQSAYARGFAVLTLVDGRRDSRLYGGSEVPVQGIFDLERIEVLRGPSSALYGYGATGGTMNLIRRRASATPLHELELGLGTPRLFRAHLGSQGAIAPKLSQRTDLGHTTARNFRGYELSQSQATSTLRYAPSRRHTLQLRTSLAFNHSNTDAGIPTREDPSRPGRWALPPNTRLQNRYNTPNDFLRYQHLDVGLDYRAALTSGWFVEARANVAYDKYGYLGAESLAYVAPAGGREAQVTRAYWSMQRTFRPVFAQLEVHGELDTGSVHHQLVLGYQLDHIPEKLDRFIDPPPAPTVDFVYPVEAASKVALRREASDQNNGLMQSVYLFDHLRLTRMLVLTGGGRIDAVLNKTRRAFLDVVTQDEVPSSDDDTFQRTRRTTDLAGSGQVGLVLRPVEPLIGYVSYASAYRPQFERGPDSGVAAYKPEKSHQLEGGVRLRVDARAHALEVDAAGYLIRKKNLLTARGPEETVSAGLAQSRGLDLSLRYAGFGLFELVGGYSLTDAEFKDFLAPSPVTGEIEDFAGKVLRNAPRHSGNVWFRVTPLESLSVGVGSRLVGELYADDPNRIRLPRYALLDASLSLGAGRFSFTLSANNLLDRIDYFTSSVNYYGMHPQITPGSGRELIGLARVAL